MFGLRAAEAMPKMLAYTLGEEVRDVFLALAAAVQILCFPASPCLLLAHIVALLGLMLALGAQGLARRVWREARAGIAPSMPWVQRVLARMQEDGASADSVTSWSIVRLMDIAVAGRAFCVVGLAAGIFYHLAEKFLC